MSHNILTDINALRRFDYDNKFAEAMATIMWAHESFSDAFSRIRVASPPTVLVDNQQVLDNSPLSWEVAFSGTGATASYSQSQASTVISSGTASNGYSLQRRRNHRNDPAAGSSRHRRKRHRLRSHQLGRDALRLLIGKRYLDAAESPARSQHVDRRLDGDCRISRIFHDQGDLRLNFCNANHAPLSCTLSGAA